MTDISIVTAFFDIGRGGWTADKGFPFYLARSSDTYIERFANLCELKNDITVFTSPDFEERLTKIAEKREGKTNILTVDLEENFSDLLSTIESIQQSEDFLKKVHPSLHKNPEYWNKYYVLVTNLKARFTYEAIKEQLPIHDMVAWIDFGYVRDMKQIPPSKKWTYEFDSNKIHLFEYKEKDPERTFEEIIGLNDVHILGAKVVAHKDMWPHMDRLMRESWEYLQTVNMVDDDQGLWLISKHKELDKFQCHTIPDHQFGHDPFVLFNEFNDSA